MTCQPVGFGSFEVNSKKEGGRGFIAVKDVFMMIRVSATIFLKVLHFLFLHAKTSYDPFHWADGLDCSIWGRSLVQLNKAYVLMRTDGDTY